MKQLIKIGLVSICVLTFATTAWSYRCGSNMYVKGDFSFKVQAKCGDPVKKEIVGYLLTKDKKREYKIEHWLYGPEGGLYYLLVFEGGRLVKVETFRE